MGAKGKEHKWMARQREKQIKSTVEGVRRKEKAAADYFGGGYVWEWDNVTGEVIITNTSPSAVGPKFDPKKFEDFYDTTDETTLIEYHPVTSLIKKICH